MARITGVDRNTKYKLLTNRIAARAPSDSALVHFWRKVTSVGGTGSGWSGRVTGRDEPFTL